MAINRSTAGLSTFGIISSVSLGSLCMLFLLTSIRCPNNLKQVYQMMVCPKSESAFNLLSALLEYDPAKRITADKALNHPYFQEDPKPIMK
jgi:serine/threonine protein kinase